MKDILRKIIHLLLIKKSYSQDHEDLFLINYFKNKNKGYYFDIGCHHPKRFSNTYLLYKKGWNGINIDANKWSIILFKWLRPKDQNLCTVISTSNDFVTFYEFNDSAINGILSPRRVSKLKELGFIVKRSTQREPHTIQEVIEKYNIYEKHIDFFKIDVEGLDFEIIKNLFLLKIDIELLMIEKASEQENNEIIKFLAVHYFKIIYESKRNFIFKKILK